jgi:hypothetical protein
MDIKPVAVNPMDGGNEMDARPLALMPVSVRMHTVPNIYLGAKKSNHNIVIDP